MCALLKYRRERKQDTTNFEVGRILLEKKIVFLKLKILQIQEKKMSK